MTFREDDADDRRIRLCKQQIGMIVMSTRPLLNRVTRFRERGRNSFRHVARLVLDKLPEPRCNVRLCDVGVVASSHGGRAMAHQAGQ